jgi:hypothetical protein
MSLRRHPSRSSSARLSGDSNDPVSYFETSAPSITIILLQILYTIRSERLMEQLDYNLLWLA